MSGPQFVAVDWGTTSFRLWLMGAGDQILAESQSREGMTTARETGFAGVLDRHLSAVNAPADIPVIMCGMVGAKQGWVEAGYIDVPTRLDHISSAAIKVPGMVRDIRILPGLAQRDPKSADVMRGEETQLLGCVAAIAGRECLVAMPGTHSKWVHVRNGRVERFSTFMTGEMFDVISKHSILSHAVKDSGGVDAADPIFTDAVDAAFRDSQHFTNRLFSIRAQGLLFALQPTAAEATLSGSLIGLELSGALVNSPEGAAVILVATGRLRALYESAFARLGLNTTTLDANVAGLHGLCAAAREIWTF